MMGLDIRVPIGLMFTVMGAILTVFGLVSKPEIYKAHSLGININLIWGLVTVGFGVIMLILAFRARRA
ncbi:MAG: hypothetical protein ABFD49_03660 [Armatimonadota bacterium]|nr:hypothetical protein [bacterium]